MGLGPPVIRFDSMISIRSFAARCSAPSLARCSAARLHRSLLAPFSAEGPPRFIRGLRFEWVRFGGSQALRPPKGSTWLFGAWGCLLAHILVRLDPSTDSPLFRCSCPFSVSRLAHKSRRCGPHSKLRYGHQQPSRMMMQDT